MKGGGQDPQPEPEGTGSGRTDPSEDVSGSAAESGVYPDGTGTLSHGGAGQAVRLGDGAPATVKKYP